uniref:Uncharacterized protein n=1 Tax=Ditylenchus dipsaci TaxID=166011 RepID=A0A915D8M6_9BILA
MSTDQTREITSFFDQQQTVDARQRKVDEESVRIHVRQNASMCFFDDEDVQARTKKVFQTCKYKLSELGAHWRRNRQAY